MCPLTGDRAKAHSEGNNLVSKAILLTRSTTELSNSKISAEKRGNHNWLWPVISRNSFLMSAWLVCNFNCHKDLEEDWMTHHTSLPLFRQKNLNGYFKS